jgi:hypothetical protein
MLYMSLMEILSMRLIRQSVQRRDGTDMHVKMCNPQGLCPLDQFSFADLATDGPVFISRAVKAHVVVG